MPADPQEPPQYTRYRAGRRLRPRKQDEPRESGLPLRPLRSAGPAGSAGVPVGRWNWRRWRSAKRVLLTLLALAGAWVGLSLVLFLVSSHFQRTSLPADVASVLDPAGYPLTSANNIL